MQSDLTTTEAAFIGAMSRIQESVISNSVRRYPKNTLDDLWTCFLREVDELKAAPLDPDECADVANSLMHYCKRNGINLGEAIVNKVRADKKRPAEFYEEVGDA